MLISAPAGYGKTSLLGEWVKAADPKAAWVTVDEADNDIARFLRYLSEALRTQGVELHEDSFGMLVSPEATEIGAITIQILNKIVQREETVILILDDFHLITNPLIHHFIEELIEHQPPNFQLILSTRADPAFSLAKLRASGGLIEIRVDDLRFDPALMKAYLNELLRLNLTREELELLFRRTEGWPAGLYLVSLILNSQDNTRDFIESFSGGHAYIAEYLADEVLGGLPPDQEEFLLATSVFDRFSAELCNEALMIDDSARILDELEAGNLFLISMSVDNRWYRYHQLFADVLKKKALEQSGEQSIRRRFERASDWFDAQGLFHEAIAYALQARDFERTFDLIGAHLERMIRSGEIYLFSHWMSQIPFLEIVKRPEVAIYYAWILLVQGQEPDLAARLLSFLDSDEPANRGRIDALRSLSSVFIEHNPTRGEQFALKALERLDPSDSLFREMTALHLSAIYYLQDKREEGFRALVAVEKMGRSSGNLMLTATALSRLGSVSLQSGNLAEAELRFKEAIGLLDHQASAAHHLGLTARIGLAKIHYFWNNLEAARKYIEGTLELKPALSVSNHIDALDTCALILHAVGESDRALEKLEEASNLSAQTSVTDLDDRYIACQRALLAIKQDELDEAIQWAHRISPHLDDLEEGTISLGQSLIACYENWLYALLLFAERRPGDTVNILGSLDQDVFQKMGIDKALQVELLLSLAYHELQEQDASDAAMLRALDLAGPGNYTRPFLEFGLSVHKVLAGLNVPEEQQYFRDQIVRFLEEQYSGVDDHSAGGLIEPLTQREKDVLNMLATELSVPEIAESMHLAESTIRSHVKNIYGKLDAHSRYEAVSRARDQGLV